MYLELLSRYPFDPPKLGFSRRVHDTPRHYAEYSPSGNVITVAPAIARRSPALIRGVLAHELGHAMAYAYAQDGQLIIPSDYDAAERQADALAEEALGLLIRYNENDWIQRAGIGARGIRPRPEGVR